MAKKAKAAPKNVVDTVKIPALDIRTMSITLESDSPLLMHRFGEKAKTAMLEKQMKIAQGPRDTRNPEAEYKASMYLTSDGHLYFPATAFKKAAVDACSQVSGIHKTLARSAFHVVGDQILVNGKPRMRSDMVRVANGSPMERFRAEIPQWKVVLTIRYNQNVLARAQILNLFNTAGFGVGVGEWRPQKNGTFGMFHVK